MSDYLFKVSNKKLNLVFLALLFIFSFTIFLNMKFGSFSGISSSYMKLEQRIEVNNSVYDIFYNFKVLDYNLLNNLGDYEIESFSPFLPGSELGIIIPSGYFKINEGNFVGSKYPVYFPFVSYFYKTSLGLENSFTFIGYISLLVIGLFFIFYRKLFDNKYLILGIFMLFSSSVLTSLFTGRFIRELFSFLIIYFSYFMFFKFKETQRWFYFYLGSFSLGISCSIRITNVIFALPILILLFENIKNSQFWKDFYKKIIVSFFLFLSGLVTFIFQTVYPVIKLNNFFIPISGNFNALKITSLVSSSNTFGLPNWIVLLNYSISNIGYIILVFILIFFMFHFKKFKNKILIFSLVSIYLINLILFGSWTNPWPRYILNAIPILVTLFLFSFKEMNFPNKVKDICMIIILFTSSVSFLLLSFNSTHYWSEVYDKNFYSDIKNIENFVVSDSLILTSINSQNLNNQNLRGYFDAVVDNSDIIGIKNSTIYDYYDYESFDYEGLYYLTNKPYYSSKLTLIYSFKLGNKINDDFYLFEVNFAE